MLKIFFLLFFTNFYKCKLINQNYSPNKLSENAFEPFNLEKLNEFFNFFKEVFENHLIEYFNRIFIF